MIQKETLAEKNENNEISVKELMLFVRDYYRYLLSRWRVIILAVLLGGLAGFTYAYLAKPNFIASTSFVLESGESGGGLGQYAGLASMMGIELSSGGGIFQGQNILELYRSRTMIEKTLLTEVSLGNTKELLVDRYIAFNNLRDQWKDKPHLKNISFKDAALAEDCSGHSRLQDSILGDIAFNLTRKNLVVTKGDKNSIIMVEVNARDEFFAKAFNDAIVKNVNDFYVQTKTKKALTNVHILQGKTDSVRQIMNGAIYTAAAVADATPNLNPTRQLQRTAPMQRSQFNAETNKAVLGELLKNLEISKMNLLRETPLIQVIDQPVFPLAKQVTGLVKGTVVGIFIAGILTLSWLVLGRYFKDIFS
jgi:hypothetical protein